MLKGTKRPIEVQNWVADVVQSTENIDIVSDGVLYTDNPVRQVLVASADDLDQLDEYAPGTIAFTGGYLNIWQKTVGGGWIAIVTEEEGGE